MDCNSVADLNVKNSSCHARPLARFSKVVFSVWVRASKAAWKHGLGI